MMIVICLQSAYKGRRMATRDTRYKVQVLCLIDQTENSIEHIMGSLDVADFVFVNISE